MLLLPRRVIKRVDEVTNSATGSLGFFYTFVCVVCWFGPLTGEEWKVMGLAAYGKPRKDLYTLFRSMIEVDGLDVRFTREQGSWGEIVDAPRSPTSELPLHLAVYRNFDAGAVVHTHPPMETAVACVVDALPCIHYTLLGFGGDVRAARYETFGTAELAESVVAALKDRAAVLMASHGALTHGSDSTRRRMRPSSWSGRAASMCTRAQSVRRESDRARSPSGHRGARELRRGESRPAQLADVMTAARKAAA